MISFISGFNKFLILCAIALVALVLYLTAVFYPPERGINYALRNTIRRWKPDMVFLGSSGLKSAVQTKVLENQLGILKGRKFRIIRYPLGGGAIAWYLVFRNQICHSGSKPPVGIFFPKEVLTRRFDPSKTDSWRLRRQLERGESFYDFQPGKKNWRSLEDILSECVLRLGRVRDMAKDLLRFFVTGILGKIAPSVNVPDVLNKKFQIGKFQDDADIPTRRGYGISYDFDESLKASLLPSIVALKHKYDIDLFVVVLPTSPRVDTGFSRKQKEQYYSKLKNYLESNGIKYIPFWDHEKLKDPNLFRDATHMKSFPGFQELLAQELVNKGVVK
ncbi:MAG: hypothetical protein PHV97_01475 [Candidatus Omnitrophica bacterium]|nr:hypothetical protein [Candidatus Omnitrophota bacterium]